MRHKSLLLKLPLESQSFGFCRLRPNRHSPEGARLGNRLNDGHSRISSRFRKWKYGHIGRTGMHRRARWPPRHGLSFEALLKVAKGGRSENARLRASRSRGSLTGDPPREEGPWGTCRHTSGQLIDPLGIIVVRLRATVPGTP